MTYQLTNLNVASLDFDDIKSSLISFLEQQSDLKDLDFRNEASSVNLLLNIFLLLMDALLHLHQG